MRTILSALVGAIIVSAAAATANAQQPQQPTGSWSAEQGGSNFYQGASATDGTYLYIYGGYQDAQTTSQYPYLTYQQLRRYDPANNTWSVLAAMPNPTMYNAGAYSNGRLFSFGGYYYYFNGANWTVTATNMIQAYDIASGTWSVLTAQLSTSRYYLTAATVSTAAGERIYIVGGTPGNGTNDEFNPSANTVAGRAAVTNSSGQAVSMYLHAMAAINSTSKVYVMGGLPGPTATVYEYSTPTSSSANGSWTTKANVQNGAGTAQTGYYRAGMTLNGRVYITGGITSPYNMMFEYNPATDIWAQRANMSGGRYGHCSVAINNKGYVYGGYQAYTTGEEYTPPNFGTAPNEPTNVAQTGSRAESSQQSLTDQTQFAGWTNDQIVFSANVTDPDTTQQVRMRIQVKPQAASWSSTGAITSLDSGLVNQGNIAVTYTIPAGGGYDWRYRIEDSYLNSFPAPLANTAAGWIEAFGNVSSPDFRSDQLSPAEPVGLEPSNLDIQVPDPVYGDVVLNWIESTDNGPVAGISYELQVAREGGFIDIEAQLFSTAGTSAYPITLTVSRDQKHWRMRARDLGGNFSEWSEPLTFRVTYNDGENHGAGDAKKCGFMVGTGAPSLVIALLGLALIAQGGRRRFRM